MSRNLWIGGLALVLGCGRAPTTPATAINIHYPYVATPERKRQIIAGFKQITPKMSAAQVQEILGTPDEIMPLYEPKIKNPKQIGITHWYFLERRAGRDSAAQTVRVSFGLNDRVTKADRWGIDEVKD